MSKWYDRKGELLVDFEWYDTDFKKWSLSMKKLDKMLSDPEYKIVKQDYLWWGAWLSTVWLGLDHRFIERGGEEMIQYKCEFCGRVELKPLAKIGLCDRCIEAWKRLVLREQENRK